MIDNTVVISTPPHVKSKRTTRSIMLDVLIALAPCAIMGIVFFGWRAVMLELTCMAGCVATEFVYYFLLNKGFANKCKNAGKTCLKWLKQFDCSSVVTGLILALILPPAVLWYEALIGSIFAIALVKMVFGGTGKNLVNPAACARVFMLLSFSVTMVKYCAPALEPVMLESDLYTGATNLGGLLANGATEYHVPTNLVTCLDLFLGTGVAGCIGETSAAAILIGYIYLSARKVIKWWQPLMTLVIFGFVSVFAMGFLYGKGEYVFDMANFLPSILSGGVAFAAVFMFTDYVTSPKGVYGQILYYGLAAILLATLRVLTRVEVASYVILLMNLFVPLIDKYVRRRPFGYEKPVKQKKAKEEN